MELGSYNLVRNGKLNSREILYTVCLAIEILLSILLRVMTKPLEGFHFRVPTWNNGMA